MNIAKESLQFHEKNKGKIEVVSKVKLDTMHNMSLAYTPGVASACEAIKNDPKESYKLTNRGNLVAVITDGTAVLGLGNIGPLAAMPVMEGKCAIFKEFADVDAIPITLNTTDVDELVKTITYMAPSFGGINLEDIAAPKCFEVERRLKEVLDIPVFHDDQHGTAIVTGAALINALKIVNKDINKINVVINGAGSAGIAITKFLLKLGVKNIIVVDRFGIITEGDSNLNNAQKEIAEVTNLNHLTGDLKVALSGADAFIGVSVGNIVTKDMIRLMNDDAIVFPLANPVPEISRADALSAGARIVGSGLSNYPNQINNSLVFPGLFKGALEGAAKEINDEMQIAACHALASVIKDEELKEDYIIPSIFNKEVVKKIIEAVKKEIK